MPMGSDAGLTNSPDFSKIQQIQSGPYFEIQSIWIGSVRIFTSRRILECLAYIGR
jgi:hypothetical protein